MGRGTEREVVCPACGRELGWRDEVFTLGGGDGVAGCSRCLRRHNALEWAAGVEAPREYWQI